MTISSNFLKCFVFGDFNFGFFTSWWLKIMRLMCLIIVSPSYQIDVQCKNHCNLRQCLQSHSVSLLLKTFIVFLWYIYPRYTKWVSFWQTTQARASSQPTLHFSPFLLLVLSGGPTSRDQSTQPRGHHAANVSDILNLESVEHPQ